MFRSVTLCHGSAVHVKDDGIYVYTKEIADDVAYLEAEIDVCNMTGKNRLAEVSDASLELTAAVDSACGAGYLAGFGTGNPFTEDNYTDNRTVTHNGHAMAVIRSGYEEGNIALKVEAPGCGIVAECMI